MRMYLAGSGLEGGQFLDDELLGPAELVDSHGAVHPGGVLILALLLLRGGWLTREEALWESDGDQDSGQQRDEGETDLDDAVDDVG